MTARLIGVALGALMWMAGAGLQAVSLEEVKNPRHPAVAALNSFARTTNPFDTVLILRGDVSPKQAARIKESVWKLHKDIKRRFLRNRDKSDLRPVDVCLFAEPGSYRRFARTVTGSDSYRQDRGFFVPYRRLVVVDLSRGLGPLRHELTHVLLRDDLGSLPDWLDEGIASLYVEVQSQKQGLVFMNHHRLAEMRTARAAGRMPSLEELASIDDRQLYGPRWAEYYAASRFLLLYLDRQGKLELFVKSMYSKRGSRALQLQLMRQFIDKKAFSKWLETL